MGRDEGHFHRSHMSRRVSGRPTWAITARSQRISVAIVPTSCPERWAIWPRAKGTRPPCICSEVVCDTTTSGSVPDWHCTVRALAAHPFLEAKKKRKQEQEQDCRSADGRQTGKRDGDGET